MRPPCVQRVFSLTGTDQDMVYLALSDIRYEHGELRTVADDLPPWGIPRRQRVLHPPNAAGDTRCQGRQGGRQGGLPSAAIARIRNCEADSQHAQHTSCHQPRIREGHIPMPPSEVLRKIRKTDHPEEVSAFYTPARSS